MLGHTAQVMYKKGKQMHAVYDSQHKWVSEPFTVLVLTLQWGPLCFKVLLLLFWEVLYKLLKIQRRKCSKEMPESREVYWAWQLTHFHTKEGSAFKSLRPHPPSYPSLCYQLTPCPLSHCVGVALCSLNLPDIKCRSSIPFRRKVCRLQWRSQASHKHDNENEIEIKRH